MRTKDLTGKRFGRLQVIGKDPKSVGTHETKWICVCDCGGENLGAERQGTRYQAEDLGRIIV